MVLVRSSLRMLRNEVLFSFMKLLNLWWTSSGSVASVLSASLLNGTKS